MRMKHLLLVQFFAWAVFTLTDFIDETFGIGFEFVMCLSLPIVILILYFLKREKELPLRKRIKQVFILILEWSVITIPVAIFISILVMHDIWIVHQGSGFLNGIEYIIFGLYFLFPIPIIIVFVGEILILLFQKCVPIREHTRMKHLLLVQFFAWAIFTLADFIIVVEGLDEDFQLKIYLCIPIVAAVLYFVKREKELLIGERVKQISILIFEWFFITLCSASFIFILVWNDMWICSQHATSLIAGIEYVDFGLVFLFPIPIIIVFVGEILILLFEKYRAYRKTHS